MASHKITDFVDQSAIDGLQNLKKEMGEVKDTYVEVARELAKGLKVPVDGMDQLERLSTQVAELQRKAAEATQRHSNAIEQQGRIVANTTNTISRQLMEQEKLNEKTRDAYTRQTEVKKALESAVTSYDSMVKRLVDVGDTLQEVNRAKKEEKRLYEEGKSTYDQYHAAMDKLVKKEQELKAEKAQLEGYTKSEAKENINSASSYNALSQELSRLKRAYRELDEEGRASETGRNMLSEIKELGAHLKDLDASMGDFQRNVGDYAIAGGSVKKELKEMVLEIANLTVAYRNMSDEEKSSAAGQELQQKIQAMTEQAGALRDAVSDTTAAISNAASDTRAFDQITEGIGLMIDGFGLATGAAQMLGLSEQDLVEVQTKLQAAIAASNALKSIQAKLQKESALMQGVELIQTKAAAAAISIKTAAEGKGIIVTKAATVAQAALNAVAKANPYVLLATVVVGVIAALAGLVVANKKAKASEEEAQKAAEARTRAMEKQREESLRFSQTMADTASRQISVLMQMRAQWKSLGKDMAAQKKFIEQNRDKFKELGYSVNSVTEAESILSKNTDKVIKIIMRRAEAAAYAQAMTAAWSQAIVTVDQNRTAKFAKVKAGDGQSGISSDEFAMLHEKGIKFTSSGKVTEQAATEINAMRRQKAIEQAQDNQRKAIDDANRKSEEYAGRMAKLGAQSDDLAKTLGVASDVTRKATGKGSSSSSSSSSSEKGTKRYDELRDIAVKSRKDAIDRQLALEQEGTQQWLDLKVESLNAAADIEKAANDKSLGTYLTDLDAALEKGKVTREQYGQMRTDAMQAAADKELAIEDKLITDISDARDTLAAAEMQRIEEQFATYDVIADNEYNRELADLEKLYAEKLKLAGRDSVQREKVEKEHEEAVARLSETYAKRKAKASVAMMQMMLQSDTLTEEEREQLEQRLAQTKIELEREMTNAVINENKRQADADRDLTQQRMENTQKWLQLASEGLSAVADLASTVYDTRIEQIESEQEESDEAAEREQTRIEDLVEKKVITEEEGEARKRAAEAKTAQKQEELERRKMELKKKQAIWDKANGVAQAGISTALAILSALQTKPFPVGIAMAAIAGAIGAVQIATILATPIPQYAKGTSDHPGGLAIVGDGGKAEVVTFGGRMYLTPDTPTLVDMPRGAEVYPDAERFSMPLGALDAAALKDMTPSVVVNNDYTDLKKEVAQLGELIRLQTKGQRKAARAAQLSAIRNAKSL